MPKILEVDACLRTHPVLQRRIREVHPEVCFCVWNSNKAMACKKKSRPGREEREALIESRYGHDYRVAQDSLPRGQYNNDHLLDAFAALWTAERFAAGVATVIPPDPPLDSWGLRMETIV